MALTPSFKFFSDSSLTVELTAGLLFTATTNVTTQVDKSLFLGSNIAARKLEAASDPSVDDIVVTLVDLAAGAGVAITDFVVAPSQLGLDVSTVQSLNLGTVIESGVGNAAEIWIRFTPPVDFEGTDTQLRVTVVGVLETDVS